MYNITYMSFFRRKGEQLPGHLLLGRKVDTCRTRSSIPMYECKSLGSTDSATAGLRSKSFQFSNSVVHKTFQTNPVMLYEFIWKGMSPQNLFVTLGDILGYMC